MADLLAAKGWASGGGGREQAFFLAEDKKSPWNVATAEVPVTPFPEAGGATRRDAGGACDALSRGFSPPGKAQSERSGAP